MPGGNSHQRAVEKAAAKARMGREVADIVLKRIQERDPKRISKLQEFIIFALLPAVGVLLLPSPKWIIWMILLFPLSTLIHLLWTWNARSGKLKVVYISILFGAYCFGANFSIKADQRAKLNAIQTDTFKDLTIVMERADNPLDSLVVFTNGGDATISKDHKVECKVNSAVYDRHNRAQNFSFRVTQKFSAPMHSGERESNPCLLPFANLISDPIVCIDVTTTVIYSIEDEPSAMKNKSARWVATKIRNFAWNGEPVDAKGSYCEDWY
jgi:hypothetical protein